MVGDSLPPLFPVIVPGDHPPDLSRKSFPTSVLENMGIKVSDASLKDIIPPKMAELITYGNLSLS